MDEPLISIVVPVYNVKAYLDECVRSIREQTYNHIEVLLIDDGSTDGSGNLCDAYARADARVRVIHQPNAGLGAARNRGIDESSGAFITFVDSDDVISQEYLSCLYALCASHPGHISTCRETRFRDGGQPGYAPGEGEDTGVLTVNQALLWYMYQHPLMITNAWGRMFPAGLLKNAGIRFPDAYYEDLGTMYKWFLKSRGIAYTSRRLYGYRQRGGIMLGGFSEKKGRDILSITEGLMEDFSTFPKALFRAARCRCFCAVCNVYMTVPRGEYAEWTEALWKRILQYRVGVPFSRQARARARVGALASHLGPGAMRGLYGLLKRASGD